MEYTRSLATPDTQCHERLLKGNASVRAIESSARANRKNVQVLKVARSRVHGHSTALFTVLSIHQAIADDGRATFLAC